jgi:glycosyltransferase involved in cell wall biosynthesis
MWRARNYKVVPHMVDTDLFQPNFTSPKSNAILSVVNDYKERNKECGYSVWQKNTAGLNTKLVGTSNCGISTPAKDVNELLSYYQSHKIFLNTSLVSPLPMSVLEAMACGLCVISTNTCDLPNVIRDGYNGYLFDPAEDISEQLKQLTNYDDKTFLKIGNNARNTILEKFSKTNFVKNWCDVIDGVL